MIYSHLARRLPREFKANLFRYLALFFILVLGIYLVSSFSISYDTMVVLTERTAEECNVEDGDFATFLELTDDQKKQLERAGVQYEDQSYIDASLRDENGGIVCVSRIMRARKDINTICIDEGQLPKLTGEVLLERGFAQKHGYTIGSEIEIVAGFKATVCGTGVVPDYNMPLKNLSDGASDREHFGLVFVANSALGDGYQDGMTYMRAHIDAPINYNYSFKLGENSYDDVKAVLAKMEFNYKNVEDEFFQEAVYNRTKDMQDLLSGMKEMSAGIDKLASGMKMLSDNVQPIRVILDGLIDNLDSESLASVRAVIDGMQEQIDALGGIALGNAQDALEALGYDGSGMTLENHEQFLSTLIAGAPEADKPKLQEVQNNLSSELALISDMTKRYVELKTFVDATEDPAELKNKVDEYFGSITEAYNSTLKLQKGMLDIQDALEGALNKNINASIDNVMQFLRKDNNPRILASRTRAASYRVVIWIIGIVLLVLVSYVLSVFVVQQLNREVKTIGALYALGLRKRELLAHYITLPTVVTTLGSVLGLVLALTPLKVDAYSIMARAVSVVAPGMVVLPYLIICCIILPPVISAIVNLLSINSRLSKPALALLNNSLESAKKAPARTKKVKKAKPGKKSDFVRTFQLRQVAREARTGGTIVFGVFNCILLIILGFSMQFFCLNLINQTEIDLNYNYMYVLKYPPMEQSSVQAIKDAGGEFVFNKLLDSTFAGKTANITLMGIEQKSDTSEGSKYFPAECEKGNNSLTVSSALANKYFLKVGDKVIMTDSDAQYTYLFYVKAVCDYDVGLCAFMDIDSMRSLFKQPSDYYNLIVSKNQIGSDMLEEGRVYSVITKDEITTTASQMQSQVQPMVIMAVIIGFLIMVLVMIILTSVMIDRATVGISLTRIFGYSDKEIKKLYLNGNFLIVGIGAALSIPISILLARLLIDFSTLNFNIGINIFMPWWAYILFFGVVMLAYWGVSVLLQFKLKKVPLTEALKSRG